MFMFLEALALPARQSDLLKGSASASVADLAHVVLRAGPSPSVDECCHAGNFENSCDSQVRRAGSSHVFGQVMPRLKALETALAQQWRGPYVVAHSGPSLLAD